MLGRAFRSVIRTLAFYASLNAPAQAEFLGFPQPFANAMCIGEQTKTIRNGMPTGMISITVYDGPYNYSAPPSFSQTGSIGYLP